MFLPITSFAIGRFLLREGGRVWLRLALGSHTISRGKFLSLRILVFLWGPKVEVTAGCSWKSGDHTCLTSRRSFKLTRAVCVHRTCTITCNWPAAIFGAKFVIKSAFGFMDCAKTWKAFPKVSFHKQLHDYQDLQVSSKMGEFYYVFKFFFHMHSVLKLFGENLPLRFVRVSSITAWLHWAWKLTSFCLSFRISSDANIINFMKQDFSCVRGYKTNLVKLGVKTINAVPVKYGRLCFCH